MRFMKIGSSLIGGLFRIGLQGALQVVPQLTLLCLIGALSQPASANYEYRFTISSGSDQLQGDIVTTTNSGALSRYDIVSFDFYDTTAQATVHGASNNLLIYSSEGAAVDTGLYATPTAILLNDWAATNSGYYLNTLWWDVSGERTLSYATSVVAQGAAFDFYCNSGCATNGDHLSLVPGLVYISDVASLSTETPPPVSAAVQTTLAAPVPEPSIPAQLGAGLLVLGGVRQFRRARS